MYAWPGLTGEGPPLLAYARMTDAERAVAVGADGPANDRIEARKHAGIAPLGRGDQRVIEGALAPLPAWPGMPG